MLCISEEQSKSRHKASEDATYHIHFKKRVKLCKHHGGVKGDGNSGKMKVKTEAKLTTGKLKKRITLVC
jgi:hypothetical protein